MLGPEDLGTWPTRSSPGPATHHGAVKREGNSLRRAPAWVFPPDLCCSGGQGGRGSVAVPFLLSPVHQPHQVPQVYSSILGLK